MYNFSYEKVNSVDKAVEVIKSAEDGKFLAGGQTMLPTMKHRLADPSNLIDLGGVKQLKEIIGMKFDRVLFDNMSIKNLKTGIKLAKKYYETEASGNINLKTVKSIAATGVNRISVGSITHSAPAVDFKLEIN